MKAPLDSPDYKRSYSHASRLSIDSACWVGSDWESSESSIPDSDCGSEIRPVAAIMQRGILNITAADWPIARRIISQRWRAESVRYPHTMLLSFGQVKHLDSALNAPVSIQGRGNFPTVQAPLRHVVATLQRLLREAGVPVRGVQLYGEFAGEIASGRSCRGVDAQVLFSVDLTSRQLFELVKQAVLDSLLQLLPDQVNKSRLGRSCMHEGYVHKMFKVCDEDRWSMIWLSAQPGCRVHLKFVNSVKRDYTFSTDALRIDLDALLLLHKYDGRVCDHFYPAISCCSLSGSCAESLRHLQLRRLVLHDVDGVRGGGLLLLCRLLVCGYTADPCVFHNLDAMCHRFLDDFPSLNAQTKELADFMVDLLHEHGSEDRLAFLTVLRGVLGATSLLQSLYHAVDVMVNQLLVCRFTGVPVVRRSAYRPNIPASKPALLRSETTCLNICSTKCSR